MAIPLVLSLLLAGALHTGPVQGALTTGVPPSPGSVHADRPTNAEGPPPAPIACDTAQAAMASQASRLLRSARQQQAVLLGEIHTSSADHAWQLASLEALAGVRATLSLGLEMVPAARQSVLDRFNAGQLDEAAFLEQVGWNQVWGHDPELYLPLLRWARLRSVPLLALNADPELVRRVRREGLAAVPAAEREGIGMPVPASPAYRQQLERQWRGHRLFAGAGRMGEAAAMPSPSGPKPDQAGNANPSAAGGPAAASNGLSAREAADLQHFIDSQLLRDRAMAERIAAVHRRDPQRLVVALIGRGHLENGDGVPRQLADLGLRNVLSLTRVALPEGCSPAPSGARLGAYLESENGRVWVRRVAPGSAAARAGLRPGDRILELNGQAVERAGQVIRRVRLQPDGEPLRLTILRGGRRLQLQLTLPASSEPRQAGRDNGEGSPPPVLLSALSSP